MKKFLFASLAVLFLMASSASASLIVGDIGFSGGFTPVEADGTTPTTLALADGVDILGDVATVSFPLTGDFATFSSLGSVATFNDFVFDPFPGSGITPLWTVDGFSFDLTNVTIVAQSSLGLTLAGTGVVTGNGFSATPGTFNFSGNPVGGSFNFSSGVAVPEPISALVWGGLAMLGVAVRRCRRS